MDRPAAHRRYGSLAKLCLAVPMAFPCALSTLGQSTAQELANSKSASAEGRPQEGVESIRLPVVRDSWISAYPAERQGNNGGSPKIKLKGIEEMSLVDIDPTPLAGCEVIAAQLHLHAEGDETLGRVTLSTVAIPWEEGEGESYAVGGPGCSFVWADRGKRRWGTDGGGDVTDAALGQAGTVWSFADATKRTSDGWQTIPVSAEVLQARVDGQSHGFLVVDDVGSEYRFEGDRFEFRLMPNRFFSSRQRNQRHAPYFTVWFRRNSPGQRSTSPPPAPLSPAIVSVAIPEVPPPSWKLPENLSIQSLYGHPLEPHMMAAAKGEAICFWIDAKAREVRLLDDDGVECELFEAPTIQGHHDPLIPIGFPASAIPSVKDSQRCLLEIYIPRNFGEKTATPQIEVAGKKMELPIQIWSWQLPDRLTFIPQMNCYSLPDHEMDYYRLAHRHRTCLNRLMYSWNGRVAEAARPKQLPDGSWNWSDWDSRFGPLLDGSAFLDQRRPGAPVDAFYLPLNENWPMQQDKFFQGGYWIENAYPEAYWDQFRDAATRFARHLSEKGWKETMFEFYLNNKVYHRGPKGNQSSAYWIFDEPVNTQDFWALRRFGIEYWRAVADAGSARMTYRADISRPQWQRDLLDGVTSVDVVNGNLREYHDRASERKKKFGTLAYMYGGANPLHNPYATVAAWSIDAWAQGADGVVPWQTIGTPKSWEAADELSVFYPTKEGPVPSVRLKSFRAGQQLVEYLNRYTQVAQVDSNGLREWIRNQPQWSGQLKKKNEEDAGQQVYSPQSGKELEQLRYRLGSLLEELHRRNQSNPDPYDPRPPRFSVDRIAPRDLVPPIAMPDGEATSR
jgi:hypothetical protein